MIMDEDIVGFFFLVHMDIVIMGFPSCKWIRIS